MAKVVVEDVFEIGDIVTIETIPFEKDTVLVKESKKYINQTRGEYGGLVGGEKVVTNPAVISKKGSYKSYRIILSDGRRYGPHAIFSKFGYAPLSRIFSKISEGDYVK